MALNPGGPIVIVGSPIGGGRTDMPGGGRDGLNPGGGIDISNVGVEPTVGMEFCPPISIPGGPSVPGGMTPGGASPPSEAKSYST